MLPLKNPIIIGTEELRHQCLLHPLCLLTLISVVFLYVLLLSAHVNNKYFV